MINFNENKYVQLYINVFLFNDVCYTLLHSHRRTFLLKQIKLLAASYQKLLSPKSTCCAVGGMPLAFTQEDFLVVTSQNTELENRDNGFFKLYGTGVVSFTDPPPCFNLALAHL